MADQRVILADQCARWIILTTRSNVAKDLKQLDELTIKSQLTKQEEELKTSLVSKLSFERPDLSADEAVVNDYDGYWLELLTEALNKQSDCYSVVHVDEKTKALYFDTVDKTKKAIFLNLEFVDDAKEHRTKTIMLKSHKIGIQYVKNL